MNIQPNESSLAFAVEADNEFDPLEDNEPVAEDETDEFYGEFEARTEVSRSTIQEDNRPASQRIEALFAQMKPRRKTLMGILAFCTAPQAVAAVNQRVLELQVHDKSVFSAASFCAALEKAGALVRKTAEGTIVDEEALNEPTVVEVDGVEYLEAAPEVEVFWVTTDAGNEVLEADKPLERLASLFERDARYLPIYERILDLCAAEGGASADELGAAVDKDPLVQDPRLFAPHFFDKLEKCDALVWNKTWQITEVGARGKELLLKAGE